MFADTQDLDHLPEGNGRWESAVGGIMSFTLHILTGTLLFLMIAGAALGVGYFNQFITLHVGAPAFFGKSLAVVEYVILAADMLLFLIFMLRSTIEFVRRLWSDA